MTDSNEMTGSLHGNATYRRLLGEIAAGGLLPGDRLRETEIAERLGVSRTPVREAIRQLEADGLVTHVPRQGASVRRLDHAEMVELYEMRAVLEGMAARLAARAADIELDELEAINADLAGARSAHEAFRLNRMFHAALLDAARNRFLRHSMDGLQKAMMILGPTTLAETARFEVALSEHAALLEALRARDGERAEAAMRAHIETSGRARIRALRDGRVATDDPDPAPREP